MGGRYCEGMKIGYALFTITMFTACTQSGDGVGAEPPTYQTFGRGEPTAAPADVADDILGDKVGESGGIALYQLDGSKDFYDSHIELESPAKGNKLEPGAHRFAYDVVGYDLRDQTYAPAREHLANSAKGQHIHFIVDNGPYNARYRSEFEHELEEGHHVVLAFLSRSYHESVKGTESLTQLTVGDPDGEPIDLSEPHMFYSRPKGTYVGKDTQNVLLDFFLSRAYLTADGYHVEASINGNTFTLTQWRPYVIRGLPMGESTIRLRLIDGNGNPVPGPYNDVTRTITLKES